MRKFLLGCLLQVCLLNSTVTHAAPASSVDLVFVLDTTGSMGGLIHSAKTKIWSIVNTIQTDSKDGKPVEVRVGLVAYRDRQDAYEVKISKLNSNLDEIYADLMEYRAEGGNDFPEDVQQALHRALTELNWSESADTKKILFLVGDAPPHRDYNDYPTVEDSAKKASNRGIVLNAIQMGNDQRTEKDWKAIASLANGDFFNIPLDGQTKVIPTPYDADLAALGSSIASSAVYFGDVAARVSHESSGAKASMAIEAAPPAALADRAYNKAINSKSFDASNDLVQAIEEKRVVLADLPVTSLPENMQKMTAAEREAYVKKIMAERQERKAKILELSKKREAFIQAELKKEKDPKDSFDNSVKNALTKQLGR